MFFVFVEGFDDERFFKSYFNNHSANLRIIQYANLQKDRIIKFINSIRSMPDSDYLFFCDEDGETIERKTEKILQCYSSLEREKVFIVQFEIESWYYAGLSPENHEKLKIKKYEFYTNTLTKEQFNSKLPYMRDRIYIMKQILIMYSKDLAKKRNNSFCNFSEAFFV